VTVEASDGLSVIVRDTGVGIAAERLPATLERFTPLDPACPDPGGMVGIDLRLVTRLMERHGGRLTIESKLRVGRTVRATFPSDRIVSRSSLTVDQVDSGSAGRNHCDGRRCRPISSPAAPLNRVQLETCRANLPKPLGGRRSDPKSTSLELDAV
jgi:hypothetical protein